MLEEVGLSVILVVDIVAVRHIAYHIPLVVADIHTETVRTADIRAVRRTLMLADTLAGNYTEDRNVALRILVQMLQLEDGMLVLDQIYASVRFVERDSGRCRLPAPSRLPVVVVLVQMPYLLPCFSCY